LKLINEWSHTCGKCLTLKELVAITNVIVDYVEMGYSAEIGKRLDTIQEHLESKK
jgi:glutaredoxin-related protein